MDYQELREISPKAARRAALQILKATKGNVAQTAKLLHTTRRTIYKVLHKNENEKTWTNGLTWFLWVTSWLRSHGVDGEIIDYSLFKTDKISTGKP